MTRLGRVALAVGLLAALVLGAVGLRRAFAPDPLVLAGKALFTGSVPLHARMVGHETDLPASAVRCSNCHSQPGLPLPAVSVLPSARPASSAATLGDIFGAELSHSALVESRPRRGGPPSRYDVASFCRVLREGVDPAHVMIQQTMPRYGVSDQECHELWTFVTDH